LYLGSGVFSNICYIATSHNPRQPCLGASGAINSILAYTIATNPFMLIFVFAEFIPIPMPAILYGGIFIGKDIAAMFDTQLELPFGLGRQFLDGNVAHAAHVGGAVCGLGYFIMRRGRGGGGGGPFQRIR
jgi:membrane associated rhomboid family serine protease